MSGIYIQGMEMPKSCAGCPIGFFADEYTILHCPLTVEEISENSFAYKRSERCPLVPVPDHGDLIDRDRLEKDIDKYIGGEESRSRFHHWVQVQDAVIPMDKGEEK